RQLTIVGPEDDKAAHVELKYRLGKGKEQKPGGGARAGGAYRDILDIEPAHGEARGALEGKVAGGKQKIAAARLLEPVYEQLGEWNALVGVHEIQLAAEKDSLRRTSLLLRIGELQRTKLVDAEKAFDAYARAFRADPAVEAAKEQLEALAALLDNGW